MKSNVPAGCANAKPSMRYSNSKAPASRPALEARTNVREPRIATIQGLAEHSACSTRRFDSSRRPPALPIFTPVEAARLLPGAECRGEALEFLSEASHKFPA